MPPYSSSINNADGKWNVKSSLADRKPNGTKRTLKRVKVKMESEHKQNHQQKKKNEVVKLMNINRFISEEFTETAYANRII